MQTNPYGAPGAASASAPRPTRAARRTNHFWPAGTGGEGPYSVCVTPEGARWRYSGLRVLTLGPGQAHELDSGPDELLILPFEGGCELNVGGQAFRIVGRTSVFDRVTDFVYVPSGARVSIRSEGGGRFALPSARTERQLKPSYGPAEGVVVETRGAGRSTRQVNNLCTPSTFPHADKLIVVEVLTPAGNWSSYPPHKHDEERFDAKGEPVETRLEEIYAFVVPGSELGVQRVYSSGAEREIDVFAEVGDGDVVLVPHGWHGPSIAPPHTDLYYLNVMAGPAAGRAWKICFDADRAAVMNSWTGAEADARVPMTTVKGRR